MPSRNRFDIPLRTHKTNPLLQGFSSRGNNSQSRKLQIPSGLKEISSSSNLAACGRAVILHVSQREKMATMMQKRQGPVGLRLELEERVP